MIVLGDENPEWLAQMIQSLAGEPVALHIVRGEFGHIGKWRAQGFELGTSPLVAYVDPDDYVLPGAFQRCIAALRDDPTLDAAFADTAIETPEGLQTYPTQLHHLCVFRRTYVAPALPLIAGAAWVPERHLEPPTIHARHIPMHGYVYRLRGDSPAKRLLAERNKPRGAFTPRGEL